MQEKENMDTISNMKVKLILTFVAGLAIGVLLMIQSRSFHSFDSTLDVLPLAHAPQESKTTGSGEVKTKTPTTDTSTVETVKNKPESQEDNAESNEIENIEEMSSSSNNCDEQSTSFNVDSISDNELIELTLRNIGNTHIMFGKQLRMVEGFGPIYHHYRMVTDQDPILRRHNWEDIPIVLEDYKLLFWGLPKVATTQFKDLFRRMTLKDNTPFSDIRKVNNPVNNNLKYLNEYSADQVTVMMNSNEWTRAMFLRHPVKRFLSAYFDKVARNYNASQLVGSNENTYRNLYPVSFENWLLFCEVGNTHSPNATNELKALKFSKHVIHSNSGICKSDQHFQPQSIVQRATTESWLDKINYWGRFENIEQDVKVLLKNRLGKDVWETYGATGWGKDGKSSVFHKQQRPVHATHASDKYADYVIHAGLYDRIRAYEDPDYQVFNNLYNWV